MPFFIVRETAVCWQDHLVEAKKKEDVIELMTKGKYYELDNVPNVQGVISMEIRVPTEKDEEDYMYKKGVRMLTETKTEKPKKEVVPDECE